MARAREWWLRDIDSKQISRHHQVTDYRQYFITEPCLFLVVSGHLSRGRAKVRVLTEMSLFFLSQINTFNAISSLNKKCNKFMYWIHGQIISCMIIWEPLQRFLFIWNNSFLCFWSLQHLLWSYQWMDAEKRKWVVPKRESSIQRSGFSWKIFLHYWNHFMWKTS